MAAPQCILAFLAFLLFAGCENRRPGQVRPGDPPLTEQVELLPAQAPENAEAIPKLNRVPDEPPAIRAARKLAADGKVADALRILNEAAGVEATKAPALALAGALLLQVGEGHTAAGVLRAAIAADATNPEPHRLLSVWYYDIGAMDDALAELDALSQLVPTDARPWRMRGLILMDFERYSEATVAYQQALKIGLPTSAKEEVLLELAESWLKLREPTRAQECLQLVPRSTQSILLESECLLSDGDIDRAMQLTDEVLSAEPDNTQAMKIKASVLREDGQFAAAISLLERAIELEPYEYDLRFQLMTAYSRSGNAAKAEVLRTEVDRLRALRAEFTQLHHNARTQPQSVEIRCKLGSVARELGKLELARTWYQAALAMDPASQQAKDALKELQDETSPQ